MIKDIDPQGSSSIVESAGKCRASSAAGYPAAIHAMPAQVGKKPYRPPTGAASATPQFAAVTVLVPIGSVGHLPELAHLPQLETMTLPEVNTPKRWTPSLFSSVRINTCISHEMRVELDQEAERLSLPFSMFIRAALAFWMANKKEAGEAINRTFAGQQNFEYDPFGVRLPSGNPYIK